MVKRMFALGLSVVGMFGCARERARVFDTNEAMGKDGVERYCGLGRAVRIGSRAAAVLPRLSIYPDGHLVGERILVGSGRATRRFGGASLSASSVERVNPRLALSERGLKSGSLPGWLRTSLGTGERVINPRRAIRVRSGRSGSQTMIACATLAPGLAGPVERAAEWQLDAALGASEWIDRLGHVGDGRNPAPRGWLESRPTTAADPGSWCAFQFEFDSDDVRVTRLLTFARDQSLVTAFPADGASGPRTSTAIEVVAARDEAGSLFYIDPVNAARPGGWFKPCGDASVRDLAQPLAGVAF